MPSSTNPGNRRSIRLSGYDYTTPGAYFITICTHQRAHLFGEIVNGQMAPNAAGQIVIEEWYKSPIIRPNLRMDEFGLMPNHFHGVVWVIQSALANSSNAVQRNPVQPPVGADSGRPDSGRPFRQISGSLGAFVAGFKAAVTKRINLVRNAAANMPVWQRNYYEHIVRRDESLNAIRLYIRENPLHWSEDRYHPAPIGPDPRAIAIWRMLQEEDTQNNP